MIQHPAPVHPPPAIQTRGLRKVFGSKVAVRDLTLDVRRGEVFGFLGPNGAGKSTSVKMLLGLITPTAGEGAVLGCPLGSVPVRRKIGFLPEHFRFYDWLTARELLNFHGRLYGMPHAELRRRAPELLEEVGLGSHQDRRLRDFSKGMMQRAGLAQALLNDPELIFLDEPTSGLDPAGRKMVRNIIKRQRERGATVFLNSHLLGEVEATCDRVAFIKHGEILEIRQLGDMEETQVSVRAGNLTAGALEGLVARVGAVSAECGQIRFSIKSAEELPGIVRYLVNEGADVYEISPRRRSLEELFLNIVGEDGDL